ncbi:TPA: serine/threonine protein kinase [Escherichia coli]|nr:serine/threonine protein kinase [Escherichia coli]KAA2027248.1 serine/threonine protein kinase [Escherichia coli]TXO70051.1 serine/threonine protein kinase [Escherichia coli]HAJ1966406.1 serine/threonine protein kinase [Escherichia coli]
MASDTFSCRRRLSAGFFSVSACSWHYPISPKNDKTALHPLHYWLHEGSEQKKNPFPIWFYPR